MESRKVVATNPAHVKDSQHKSVAVAVAESINYASGTNCSARIVCVRLVKGCGCFVEVL